MTTAEMEFCLLGPLLVRRGDSLLTVPRGKQRALLAALLLNPGRMVAVDELAELLWENGPPPSARVTVQNYVMRLRKTLGNAARIDTCPGGYRMHLGAAGLDVSRFAHLLTSARTATGSGRWDEAVVASAAALALWRGEPLEDVASESLRLREVPRLAEMRWQALEMRIDADLHLGRHAEVITELRGLTAIEPLREHPHALLMLALYRCGRQAEALAAYQVARRMLVDEIGAEPGPELRDLHKHILAGGSAVVPPSLLPSGDDGGEAPRQLPPAVRHFTGRRGESPPAAARPDPPSSSPAAPPAARPRSAAPAAAGQASAKDHLLSAARSAATPKLTGRQLPGAGQGDGVMRPVVDVFPVAIGYYTDADLADLDVEEQAGRLVDVLAPFGGQHRPWRHPARDRGADAVQRRLQEWSGPPTPAADTDAPDGPGVNPSAGSSVLYWAGHGWSDGTRTALAHARSPAVAGASGLEPQQLAQAIRARQAAAGPREAARDADCWTLVILEAEHAAQIADAVMAALHGPGAPGRLLLVAVPHDDPPAGGFISALATLLADTYRAEHRILLRDLAAQLERIIGPSNVHQRALGEAALVRTWPPAASWMSAPVDTIRHLEEVLADLSPDERSHFLVKAQGAEHGELSWFFEGREHELAQITTWLHQASSGMLMVTGRAGSGKSALLGTVLVRSLPALRDALARRGLVASPEPGATAPPESVFDAVVHLSGLDLAQATARVAGAAGICPLPSHRDPSAGIASDLDFLAGELAARAGPFTVLADALDESLDPLDIARALLARLAALPGVRILVGTRASTSESPGAPAGDENLLGALGASTPEARTPPGEPDAGDADRREPGRDCVIWVGQDQQAIGRYVAGLRAARDYGLAGRAIPHMREVSDPDIQRAAGEVADRGQEFLFARLAVYELIADPRLLTPGLARSRGQLLHGTHQDLFGRALLRLAACDDRYPLLMRALSLARGRGVPEADGIWAAIATALAPAPVPPVDAAAAWVRVIGGLLGQAAAYITADTSADRGGPARAQTVYRLAHYTFVEYFARHPPSGQVSSDPRRVAAGALLDAAARAASAGPGRLPAYLVWHLSGHAAEAGMWDDLASLPRVLDRIDPNAVTTDAIRTLFGRAIPPPIAGIIGARDTLAAASPADRPGLRQLATTIHSARHLIGEHASGWGIAAARAGRSTVHVILSGHAGVVTMVCSLTLPDGRTALASSGDDGTIRLWDPVTATPVGVPMKGHAGTVEDVCLLPAPGGRTLLASAGGDGTVRLWNPATGQPAARH